MATTIDLERDALVPVQKLCQQRLGKRIALATLWRWIRSGGRGGKLEAVQVAGAWHTTPAAFADFLRRQTEAALAPREPEDASDAALEAAGLL